MGKNVVGKDAIEERIRTIKEVPDPQKRQEETLRLLKDWIEDIVGGGYAPNATTYAQDALNDIVDEATVLTDWLKGEE